MTSTEETEVVNTAPAATEVVVESPSTEADAPEVETDAADDNAETFPRKVVEDLRRENGKYRQRAQRADTLAARLHTELVRATGRLADPTDLPFDADHLDDPDKLVAAIDELLEAKPHLASRRPTGDIGQGQRGPATASFSLLDTLKKLA